MTNLTYAEVQERKNLLRGLANVAHEPYPQYAGYWDNFKLAEIVSLKGLRRRALSEWTVGLKVLARIEEDGVLAGDVCVYNVAGAKNCILGLANVRFLEE